MRRALVPIAAVLAAAILAVEIAAWASVDHLHVGRSDFTSTYVGATLLRQGHRGDLYDEGLQAALHSQVIAPDREGNLPFVNPPTAALLVAPLSLLPLDAAYRVFGLLQLLLLVAAVLIAARGSPPRDRVAAALVGVGGVGTLALLLLGQWDGVNALALAVAYRLWLVEREAAGGAVLAIGFALAKPHLALGLALLLLGRRSPRMLAGAVAGVAAVVLVDLLAVGPAGLEGFLRADITDASRWPLASLLGFTGLTGSWLGDGTAAQAAAWVLTALALLACALLGDAWRRSPELTAPVLAAACALSLVASPHLLSQDLVVLAPAVAMALAWTATRSGAAPLGGTPAVLGLWVLLNLAAIADLGNSSPAPPGRLVPWVLAGAGVAGIVALRRRTGRTLPAAAA